METAPSTYTSVLVTLIANPSQLSLVFVKYLLSESFSVHIFSDENSVWYRLLEDEQVHGVVILPLDRIKDVQAFEYLVVLDTFQGLKDNRIPDWRGKLFLVLQGIVSRSSKVFLIFPYVQAQNNWESLQSEIEKISLYDQVKTLFVGDPLFPYKIDASEDTVLAHIVRSLSNKTIERSLLESIIYPVDSDKLVRVITKRVFSFSEKYDSVLGSETYIKNIINLITKKDGELSLIDDGVKLTSPVSFPKGENLSYKHDILVSQLRDVYLPLVASVDPVVISKLTLTSKASQRGRDYETDADPDSVTKVNPISILTPPSISNKRKVKTFVSPSDDSDMKNRVQDKTPSKLRINKIELVPLRHKATTIVSKLKSKTSRSKMVWKRKYTLFITVFLLIIVLPILSLFSSLILLRVAKSSLDSPNFIRTQSYYQASIHVADIAKNTAAPLQYLPILGNKYRNIWYIADFTYEAGSIGKDSSILTEYSILLFESLVVEGAVPTKDVLSKLSQSLDSLETRIGFVVAEIESESRRVPLVLDELLFEDVRSIRDKRENITSAKLVVNELYDAVGLNDPKTYALILQDSRIPHPSGGVISSTLLITLSGGKLIDVSAYSAEFINDQIKGDILPPPTLRDTFGVSRWHYENAGWDGDFEKSSERIIWFIEKGLDTKVDGIITIDSSVLKNLINEFGQIQLDSAGQTLSDASFDTVYNGVLDGESDYHSKFIEELWDSLLVVGVGADIPSKIAAGNQLGDSLRSKSLQIYSSNKTLLEALRFIIDDGGVSDRICMENCFYDFTGIYESTVNPVSSLLKRNAEISVSVEQGLIKRELKYTINNLSVNDYSGYLRIVAPNDVGYSTVTIHGEKDKESIVPDRFGTDSRKEIGLHVLVRGGESKTISVEWESGSDLILTKHGDYYMTLLKQPGLSSIPFSLVYILPVGRQYQVFPMASLTDGGMVRYNTTLERDTYSHLSW